MRFNQAPEWRWLQAMDLADSGLAPRRFKDDALVKRAWRYLTRWDPEDKATVRRLSNDYPILHEAHLLYQSTGTSARWIYEAGVMANRPVEELADYLNGDPEILELYERLFFDVRDALQHRGCIIGNVLMPAIQNGIVANDPDFFWKMLAYHGGWDVVKAAWETGHMTPAARDFYQRTYSEQHLKVGWMAAHSVRVTNFNAPELMSKCLDLIRYEHEAGSAQARDQAQFSLQSLLGDINIAVLGAREHLPAEEMRPIDYGDGIVPGQGALPALPNAEDVYALAAAEKKPEEPEKNE